LERLCRYVLRPPLAGDALELTGDDRVLLRLRRPWSDGTSAIRFEPSELLERLAAMIPRPRANQMIYHGAYAPRGVVHERAWSAARPSGGAEEDEGVSAAAVDGVETAENEVPGGQSSEPVNVESRRGEAAGAVGADLDAIAVGQWSGGQSPRPPPRPHPYVRPRHYAWADLLRRTFAVDVLDCPECGGRLRLLATITQHEVIERILSHLGLPIEPVSPEPAQSQEDFFA